VLEELLRIGKRTIVSFPNFGHWRVRLSLATKGRMPVTKALGHAWHDTPNIHLATIADFERLLEEERIGILSRVLLRLGGRPARGAPLPNLTAAGAVYVLERAR
jgi:methionine biosynthesis protein MetW